MNDVPETSPPSGVGRVFVTLLSVRPEKRVLRAVVGMGLTFAAVGGGIFAALTGIAAATGNLEREDPFFGIIAGTVWGFAIGTSFAVTLAFAGRGRTFERLSVPRVAMAGALGGIVLAMGILIAAAYEGSLSGVPEAFTFLPLLGAGAGVASLTIARRSARPDQGAHDGARPPNTGVRSG